MFKKILSRNSMHPTKKLKKELKIGASILSSLNVSLKNKIRLPVSQQSSPMIKMQKTLKH